MKIKVPLVFPLPNRHWFKTQAGLWASQEWTPKTRKTAETALWKWKEIK